MKLGTFLAVLLLAAWPSAAGTLFSGTLDPSLATPTALGAVGGGFTLNVTITGTMVNLLGLSGDSYITNPDGSLAVPLSATCTSCFGSLYSFANPGAAYPQFNSQGDGINHFVGGGANYDPLNPVSFAAEGKPTTDTTDPGAIRFGAVAYTFASNPMPTDWHVMVGNNGTGFIPTGNGGVLEIVVVDTYYPNNTGSYSFLISTPEPSAAWLAFSSVALLGLARRRMH
jgi:hypothetical protein